MQELSQAAYALLQAMESLEIGFRPSQKRQRICADHSFAARTVGKPFWRTEVGAVVGVCPCAQMVVFRHHAADPQVDIDPVAEIVRVVRRLRRMLPVLIV